MLSLSRTISTLAVLAAITAPSAGAADWKTANIGAYVASDNGGLRITIANAGGPVRVNCVAITTLTGVVNASPAAGVNPWATFATGQIVAGNCTVAGVPVTLACAARNIGTAAGPAGYVGGVPLPLTNANAGVSAISVGVSCDIKIGPIICATVSGTAPGSHQNSAAPVSGQLVVPAGGGQALATGASACAAIPANAAASISDAAGLNLIYAYTNPAAPANQPYLWYG